MDIKELIPILTPQLDKNEDSLLIEMLNQKLKKSIFQYNESIALFKQDDKNQTLIVLRSRLRDFLIKESTIIPKLNRIKERTTNCNTCRFSEEHIEDEIPSGDYYPVFLKNGQPPKRCMRCGYWDNILDELRLNTKYNINFNVEKILNDKKNEDIIKCSIMIYKIRIKLKNLKN